MSEQKKLELRVIAYRDDDSWVAQALECDLCVQADSLEDLETRFDALVQCELAECKERGVNIIDAIGPAPEYFQKQWMKASGYGKKSDIDYLSCDIKLVA